MKQTEDAVEVCNIPESVTSYVFFMNSDKAKSFFEFLIFNGKLIVFFARL